jgi:hypothetical protein
MPKRRRQRETGPGVVEARFTAPDEFAAGFLVRVLRDHPEVRMIRQPRHYGGGRVYTLFQVRRDADPACDACGCPHPGGCPSCGCSCEPSGPRTCACCGFTDNPAEVHQ